MALTLVAVGASAAMSSPRANSPPMASGLAAPGLGREAGGGVQRDHAAVVDQGDAVAEPFGFLHEVGDQDDRHAAVADVLDQLPGVPARLRVQARGHLVQHRDLGPADQGQRDRQPLPLPAGQRPVVVAALGGQAENVEQFVQVRRVAVERAVFLEDLADTQLGRQHARLELDADDLVDLVLVGVRVQAEQPDRAGVRAPEPDGAFDGGGFPRPVRSQDAEDLTLGHCE
jgi:hypothetical protein